MRILRVIPILIFLIGGYQSFAQGPLQYKDIRPGDMIGSYIEIYKDPSRQLSIDDVQSKPFELNDSDIVNLGFSNDADWMRFTVYHPTPESRQFAPPNPPAFVSGEGRERRPPGPAQSSYRPRGPGNHPGAGWPDGFNEGRRTLLKIEKLLIDSVQLFFQERGEWRVMTSGAHVPKQRRQLKGRSIYFPLHLSYGDSSTFYVRTISSYGRQFHASIIDSTQLHSGDLRETLIQGLYLGALIIITLYNLFLGFTVKDNVYVHYALANISTILGVLSIRGFFSYHMPDSLVNSTPFIVAGTTVLYVMASANFTARILHLRKYHRPSFYLMWLTVVASLVSLLVVTVIRMNGNQIHHESVVYTNFFFTVSAMFAGVMAYKNGSHYAKYFLIAWTCAMFGLMSYTLMLMGVFPSNFFTTNFYLLGSLIEILVMSFALSDRFSYLRKEKEQLQQSLKHKEGDLAMVISDNRMRYQFRQNMLESVEKINKMENGDMRSSLNSFVNELKLQLETEEKFNYLEENIESINKEFESRLRAQYPQLSPSELEMCHFIKLNLSIKEIARMRRTSEGAIKATRHRLKKKLALDGQNIDQAIQNI